MRIFNAIQQQNKTVRATLAGQDVVNVVVLLFRRDRDNALVIRRASQARELFARHGAQRNTGVAAELRDLLDARIAAPRRYGNIVETALTRRQSFFYSMNAKDNHLKRK
jgi:type II secretory pathway component PulJ